MDYFQGDVSNQRKFISLKVAIPLLLITSFGLTFWQTNYLLGVKIWR